MTSFDFLLNHKDSYYTPKEWAKLLGVTIIAAQGWNDADFDKSINLDEFVFRVRTSTLRRQDDNAVYILFGASDVNSNPAFISAFKDQEQAEMKARDYQKVFDYVYVEKVNGALGTTYLNYRFRLSRKDVAST